MYVEGDPTETPEYQRYADALRNLYRRPLPLGDGWALKPEPLHLNDEAKTVWVRYHDYVQDGLKEGGELRPVQGLAAKAAEHVLRLAGVLHTIDGVGTMITAKTIEQGITLVQWYLEEALRLHGAAQGNPDLVLAKTLLEWMQGRSGSVVPVADIYQCGPNQIRDKATAEKALMLLADHGWTRRVEGGADIDGKHHREAWEVRR